MKGQVLVSPEEALISAVKDHEGPFSALEPQVAANGFALIPGAPWDCGNRPRGAYQTFARSRGGRVALLRRVAPNAARLPPWRLTSRRSADGEELDYYDLWPAEEPQMMGRPLVLALLLAALAVALGLGWLVWHGPVGSFLP